MALNFTKMQGLGNDFVVINAIAKPFVMKPEQIQKLSDRRFGIGFDQLLVIQASNTPNIDFNLRIFNADGKEVGQCGNGARCVGRYIAERGLSSKKNLVLNTISSQIQLRPQGNGTVKVAMGIPEFKPEKIPFKAEHPSLSYDVNVNGQIISLGVVSMGNPHAIIQIQEDVFQLDIKELGALLEKHERFPERVNVGFMQVLNSSKIKLRVYERGSGETLACGSGACAAMVIGCRRGLLDKYVQVQQLGGELIIEWPDEHTAVTMTGPAEFVFDGILQE